MSTFKERHTLKERKAEADRIIAKFPDRIPVIVEQGEKSNLPLIDKKKYLCPSTTTVGQFMFIIRKRLKLDPSTAFFLFVNNTLPPASKLMSEIYDEHKDIDNFLYFLYLEQGVFG